MALYDDIDHSNYTESIAPEAGADWAGCEYPLSGACGLDINYRWEFTGYAYRPPGEPGSVSYCASEGGTLPETTYWIYCDYNSYSIEIRRFYDAYTIDEGEPYCRERTYYVSDCTSQRYSFVGSVARCSESPRICDDGERLWYSLGVDYGWTDWVYANIANAQKISEVYWYNGQYRVVDYEVEQTADWDWGEKCGLRYNLKTNFRYRSRSRVYNTGCTSSPCIDSDISFLSEDNNYEYYPNTTGVPWWDNYGINANTKFQNINGGVEESAYIDCVWYYRIKYIKSCIPCISIVSDQVMQCQSSNIIRLSYNCDLVENYEIFLSYNGTVIDCNGNSKYAENGVDFVAPEHVVIPDGQNYVDIEFGTIKKISGDINIEATSSNSIQCEIRTISVECDCNDSNDLCSDNFFWEKPGCADFFSSSDYYQFMIEDKG